MKKRKKMKPVTAWAGYVDGRIHRTLEMWGQRQLFTVYTSKATAKACYSDFREVEIREVPKKRAKRRSKKP